MTGRVRGVIAVVALSTVAVGCADDGPGGGAVMVPTPTSLVAPTSAPTGVVVEVASMDNSFRPEVLEIERGTEVVWTNVGRVDHDIIPVDRQPGDPGWGIDADGFGPGAQHRHVFTEPGDYPYYCSIHGTSTVGMIGVVIVS